MDIKCIALDLDCTTLNAQGVLSESNRKALEYAISRGVHIVIASGRPFGALPKDVMAVPGIEYAITSNGAAVYHIPTGKRLHGFTLEPESVREILRLTKGEPLIYETFVEGIAHIDAAMPRNPAAYGFGDPHNVQYLRSTRTPQEDILGFMDAHIHQLDSLDLIFWDKATARRIDSMLRERVPNIYCTSTIWRLLELSYKDAGKHSGVRYVTELLGLSPAQTAAFGDGDNDVDMLQYVGCGVAMANAAPACLAAADFVTGHHDEDGLAQGIYQLLGNN